MHRAAPFPDGLSGLHGFGYIGFGVGDSFGGGVANDQPCEERRGEGAAGSVGGAGLDALAGEPALFPICGSEEVVGRVEVAPSDDEVEAGIAGSEAGGGLGNGFPVRNGAFGEEGQLFEVRREPADAGQQVSLEAGNSLF